MQTIAVIGSGVAGMACAYFLRDRYRVTLYEKENRPGGHTNTVHVEEDGQRLPVDTGFMVYNEPTYPNLTRFFQHLGVESRDTAMSFSVSDRISGFEASFSGLANFFPSARSFLEVGRYQMLAGLKRLFRAADTYLEDETSSEVTLSEFALIHAIPSRVIERFLVPMAASIWSTPAARIADYPARTLFRFLKNHGMLGFKEQLQWKTLEGGSDQYKNLVMAAIGPNARLGRAAVRLRRVGTAVELLDSQGDRECFDYAIVATHANQALEILEAPTQRERALLSPFRYNINPVALHTDASVMPNARRAWASWNYRYDSDNANPTGSVHYWMNSLQDVSKKQNYFVSVDYNLPLDRDQVIWRHVYEHPRFDSAAIRAQAFLPELNREGPIFYCGSYFRYGFHEDAFTSALNVCTQLNDGKDPLS